MEVILSILVALFGIGFGIFMALQPEDAIALRTPLLRVGKLPRNSEEEVSSRTRACNRLVRLVLFYVVSTNS